MANLDEKKVQPEESKKHTAAESPAVDDSAAEANAEAESEEPPPEYIPDGGREAWMVVLGSSLALFASAGMVNAYVNAFSLVLVGRCS